MTKHYQDSGDLLPGLVMPNGWADFFRKLLIRIERADTPVNCLLAEEHAYGVVEGWEMAKARDASTLERLCVLIARVSEERMRQLERDAEG